MQGPYQAVPVTRKNLPVLGAGCGRREGRVWVLGLLHMPSSCWGLQPPVLQVMPAFQDSCSSSFKLYPWAEASPYQEGTGGIGESASHAVREARTPPSLIRRLEEQPLRGLWHGWTFLAQLWQQVALLQSCPGLPAACRAGEGCWGGACTRRQPTRRCFGDAEGSHGRNSTGMSDGAASLQHLCTGLGSCFVFNCCKAPGVESHSLSPRLPAVTQPQQGRIWAGSSAVALLIADCTLDLQGIALGICQATVLVPQELEELPPPKQASP